MFDDSIKANCFIPQNIDILFTNRSGGYSLPPYDSFNLATHVGDNLNVVERNRGLLIEKLPNQPIWLNQIHGSQVFDADVWNGNLIPTADAAVTTKKNRVLAILTADCLPILLSTTDGSVIGAVHAGWRGLASGVIEKTVELMREKIIIQDSQQKKSLHGLCVEHSSCELVNNLYNNTAVCDNDVSAYKFVDGDLSQHVLAETSDGANKQLRVAQNGTRAGRNGLLQVLANLHGRMCLGLEASRLERIL